jgi:hypothetical protein
VRSIGLALPQIPLTWRAALAFELTSAQGFHEGNKRTAALIARWFIRTNTRLDPDQIIEPDESRVRRPLDRSSAR